MKSALSIFLIFLIFFSKSSWSGTQDSAVIAFHVEYPLAKVADHCLVGPIQEGVPCSEFDTEGPDFTTHGAYLMVGKADTSAGVMAMSCSISFPRNIVDLPDWTLCADADLPSPSWPDSGETIMVSWNPDNCQREVIEQDGGHAVAGFFLLLSFGDATLSLDQTPNPDFFVTDCSDSKTEIQTPGGIIGFGSEKGFTPCQLTPISPTTWGRIKSFYQN